MISSHFRTDKCFTLPAAVIPQNLLVENKNIIFIETRRSKSIFRMLIAVHLTFALRIAFESVWKLMKFRLISSVEDGST